MEFSFKGKRHLLKGQRSGEVEWAAGKEHRLFNQAAHLFTIHIAPVHLETTNLQFEEREPRLEQLLQEYDEIFEEPRALPPHKSHHHKIALKEGTSLINVRPYRYPALQEDIIEQTIKEMLKAGVVRPSKVLIHHP